MIRKELAVFLIVGGLTVLIDYLSYRGIVLAGLLAVNQAKGAGFLIGMVFAYFANRIWTFGARPQAAGSVWRFAMLYSLTLLLNIGVNASMLSALYGTVHAVQAAFVLATGLSAALNFAGMKYFVFVTTTSQDAT